MVNEEKSLFIRVRLTIKFSFLSLLLYQLNSISWGSQQQRQKPQQQQHLPDDFVVSSFLQLDINLNRRRSN